MRLASLKKVFSFAVSLLLIISFTSVQGVKALVIDTPHFVLDSFDSFNYPTDPSKPGYWWVTLGSSFDPTQRKENIPCANGVNNDSDCAVILSEGWNKYVRMRLRPGKTQGQFSFSQLSEERDARSYNLQHRWLPTVGHPVVFTVRSRFSPNAKVDGSGGARGTLGICFWNSPTEQLFEPPFASIHPVKTLAFSWADSGVMGGTYTGFKAVVIDADTPQTSYIPTHLTQIQDVNVNEWFLQTIIWSVNSQGVQNAKFLVNGQIKADIDLERALPAMSIALWADNNQITSAPALLTQEQYHDVDFANIFQL